MKQAWMQVISLVLVAVSVVNKSGALDFGVKQQVLNKLIENGNNSKVSTPVSTSVYIKTHKTASTTITNIFFKNAFRAKQKIGLVPDPTLSYLAGYPESHISKIYPKDQNLDGIYDHVRFHPDLLKRISGQPKFVTSIREPFSHSKSVFTFFEKDQPFLRFGGSIEKFYKNKFMLMLKLYKAGKKIM